VANATKELWQVTEEELLAGDLARSRCGYCGGSGVYADDDPECRVECRCAGRPARLWEDAHLPEKGPLAGASLATLDWQALPPAVVKSVRGYVGRLEEHLAAGVGLALVGDVGTGKTHIAIGIAKIALGLGIEAVFLTMDDLLGRIKRTYDGSGSEQEVMDELAEIPLLVLDDLGAEVPTEWARNRIYTLVNRRWMDQGPLVVTTNLEPDELEARLGTRTMSRLWWSCRGVRLNGDDYRARQLSARLDAVRNASREKAPAGGVGRAMGRAQPGPLPPGDERAAGPPAHETAWGNALALLPSASRLRAVFEAAGAELAPDGDGGVVRLSINDADRVWVENRGALRLLVDVMDTAMPGWRVELVEAAECEAEP
jgi:DNA replication protein DnaC